MATAQEYVDELEKVSNEDKAALKATFADLTVDTPRTELAASHFKRLVSKVGPGAGDVLTKIIVNIVTEAAKKGMGIQ
jgi:hypothetical protein